jgi:hypothetical protein
MLKRLQGGFTPQKLKMRGIQEKPLDIPFCAPRRLVVVCSTLAAVAHGLGRMVETNFIAHLVF